MPSAALNLRSLARLQQSPAGASILAARQQHHMTPDATPASTPTPRRNAAQGDLWQILHNACMWQVPPAMLMKADTFPRPPAACAPCKLPTTVGDVLPGCALHALFLHKQRQAVSEYWV